MQQCTSRSSERWPATPNAVSGAGSPEVANAGGGESRNASSMRESGMGGSRSSCLQSTAVMLTRLGNLISAMTVSRGGNT